ncbi:hypothetical protein HPB49_018109 [Dermacentor silvarum]|uniref:Uncharacterized protein n=1 Tax=Dermacentor silvarum TaxID=543639 RepID=A0ACB8DER3_DERSI|nr:hypothetical protein HPB49_018109 [Dermacentor silvarum]
MRNAGIIEQVGGIGAYQMSHVWLVNFRTQEAKKKLLETKPFLVKGRTCVAIDPQRFKVRLKVHWCAFNVSNDAVRRAFVEYGEVKEATGDKWKTGGFDNADSTTRVVRLILRDGVARDKSQRLCLLATEEASAISASTATDAKDGGVASTEKERDPVLTRASVSAASTGTTMAEAEEVGDVSASVEDDHAASMDLDSTSSKRRLDGATSVLQEQRLRQPDHEWRVAGKKPRVTRAQRSSSLPRDDTEKT